MSFYSSDASFLSSFQSPGSGRWAAQFKHQPSFASTPTRVASSPPFHMQDMLSLNQKLDKMMMVIMDQKCLIEKGELFVLESNFFYIVAIISQQDTADLQEQVLQFGEKLSIMQAAMGEMKTFSKAKGSLSFRRTYV